MLRGRVERLPGKDVKRPAAGVRQTLPFGQIRLTTPQSFLGALAIFDVSHDPVPFNNVPVSITQRRNADKKPAIFAVGGTAEPQLVVEWLPSRGRSAEFLSVQIDVFRVNNTSPTFQIGFGYGQASVLLPLVRKIRVGSIGQ